MHSWYHPSSPERTGLIQKVPVTEERRRWLLTVHHRSSGAMFTTWGYPAPTLPGLSLLLLVATHPLHRQRIEFAMIIVDCPSFVK